jgi:hypothetical protein
MAELDVEGLLALAKGTSAANGCNKRTSQLSGGTAGRKHAGLTVEDRRELLGEVQLPRHARPPQACPPPPLHASHTPLTRLLHVSHTPY